MVSRALEDDFLRKFKSEHFRGCSIIRRIVLAQFIVEAEINGREI